VATSTLDAASLPPEEAIAFLRQKVGVTSTHWTELWNEAHSHGFMVAGAATKALVEDFRHAVAKALERGTTLAEFRRDFDAIVEKHGWEHHGTPGWRAAIIYETNLSMAYAAGRYAQMTEPATLAVFPYWQYQHNHAQRPRPQHVAWNGLTLRADDGWWGTHYPPNGWRCHCSVRVVSERMLARAGKTGPDRAPPVDLRPWKNPKTGEIVQVPHGIDPGFGYNPGAAWKAPRLPAAEAVPVPRREPPPPLALPAHLPPAAPVSRADLAAWLAEPRGALHLADMPADLARAIGAQRRGVQISADTMEKQLRHHPDLTPEEYHGLVEVLQAPQLVLRASPTHLVLLHGHERLYRAVLKTTRTAAENFLISLHRTQIAQVRAQMRKFEVLAGTIAALRDDAPELVEDDLDGE
jgi:hypothetical protein